MLRLCRVTKLKMLFLVLVCVFNFNLFEFLAAILEKSLLTRAIDTANRTNKWVCANLAKHELVVNTREWHQER